ncbi:hypothetical protein D3Z53_12935 [Lachnospiraceae bacterium]|nr:hypothetical protein [uncultured Schaedlerella sp.]NBI58944.1 hypothetical protein [Lachnospiraceae bacterium]
MENNQIENNQIEPLSLDIRKTKFTLLKDQQCSLNMQIRLAMQLHDMQTQADLEKELKVVTEQISHMVW